MSQHRILLKLAAPIDEELLGGRMFPILAAEASDAQSMAVAKGEAGGWFRFEPREAAARGLAEPRPWDLAHATLTKNQTPAAARVLLAEPDAEQSWPEAAARTRVLGVGLNSDKPREQLGAPFDQGDGFGWHLDDAHSGLRRARSVVGDKLKTITIVHLDTGYDPGHKALPPNLDFLRQRNFVDPGQLTSAIDLASGSALENHGHGTGTLGILAGGGTSGLNPGADARMAVPPDFGPLGGAVGATVVPVRIANSVVKFWTSSVAQGIDYARQIKADVISMSMGGLPSAAWADAVNAAYEAGIVIVCAAGNSFNGEPTSLIVYPARFNRVIAACGVMARGNPYYRLGGPMEGCSGPQSKMATAMAAFTPNIPWLRIGSPSTADMDGAGTSAAAPQIAAAAALWLAQHGDKYPRGWQRVEAARAALFGETRTAHPDAVLGRGILDARAALDRVPDPGRLTITPPDSARFALLHLLTGAFGLVAPDARRNQMFELELSQLALVSSGFRASVPDPGLVGQLTAEVIKTALSAILDEQNASVALRTHLGSLMATGARQPSSLGTFNGPPPDQSGLDGRPLGQGGCNAPPLNLPPGGRAPATGRGIPRQLSIPRPKRRRLRVFATDPGDSRSLGTSFVNLATVEVPWEPLGRGPVGEYLEIIDIDPASKAAYPPVNLDDPHLLAQDGYAPSEGNPQFHQQMVYAVAMRTIRNFEIALGRRALWAERFMPRDKNGVFVKAADDGYVGQLRLYPHAFRERNAYYSPERKALLFGYFDDTTGPSKGRQTVFTCLSHDIVAHETAHALLDGLHRRFQEPTNEDALAFHEAFADLVAIFQHFTFPELLRFEIARLGGDISKPSILSDIARQFGRVLHNQRALRNAISPESRTGAASGQDDAAPLLRSYRETTEAHERGAILVAAVFEAFVAIYTRRAADLLRIATGGSGVLKPGALHPDLVNRLASEAVDTAQHILTAVIRALDYMPPVDPTFGDYLRAIITADADASPDRGMGYRVAFAEAFARRGIYPPDIRNVSPDGLVLQAPLAQVLADPAVTSLRALVQSINLGSYNQTDRRKAYVNAKANAKLLHEWLAVNLKSDVAMHLGLDFGLRDSNGNLICPEIIGQDGRPRFEVHSVRPALRTTEDGEIRTDVVILITQRRDVLYDQTGPADGPKFTLRGGCTLLLDRDFGPHAIRYAISRPVWNKEREERIRTYLTGGDGSAGTNAIYGTPRTQAEVFRTMHAGLQREPWHG